MRVSVAGRAVVAAPASERRPSARKLVRELESVCTAGDAGAARALLLEFAAVRFAPDPPRSLGALAAADAGPTLLPAAEPVGEPDGGS